MRRLRGNTLPYLWSQAHAAGRAVFLEDTPKDDALGNSWLLEAALSDVARAANTLLEDAKVKLPLPAQVVLDGLCHLLQGAVSSREEDLGSAVIC